MAAEDQLAIDNVIDRICAPSHRVRRLATRTATAAPLVGEDHFRAIIVERGRVPIGKALVEHGIDPLGVHRVRDIEQDAIAAACPCRDVFRREDGDIVAFIGRARVLRIFGAFAAGPKARNRACFRIGKDARTSDDARL